MKSDRLKELVEWSGKSQTEIAKDLGLNRQRFNLYVNGNREPDDETLVRIAKYFNVSTDYLLGHDDESDEELTEYLQELKSRPEMKMLFKLSKNATKEDIEKTVKIIEALKKSE